MRPGNRPNRATPARQLALEITTQVRERKAFARDLIDSRLRSAGLAAEERDFAMLLALGVVATSGELDLLLNRVLQKGGSRPKPKVRDALRISLYELFFLHKPEHIAINQGVELVKAVSPQATGFANKVLRQAAKLKEDFPFGDPALDLEALAHQQAFPLWLAERLVTDLGRPAATQFMEASNQQPPLFLLDLEQGITIKTSPAQLQDYLPRIEAGELLVADASAQEVAALATPMATGSFLEVGSGRGTKTLMLLHNARRLYGTQPQLYALDLHAYKQDILMQRIATQGFSNVTPVTGDATQLDALVAAQKLPAQFAGALIDAPCSGTGTLRRHPEIRWRLTPEAVTRLAAQGLALLSSTAQHTEDGGFIVYSTCSVLAEENQQVVVAFLDSPAGKGFTQEGEPFCPSLAPGSPDAHFAVKLVKQRS